MSRKNNDAQPSSWAHSMVALAMESAHSWLAARAEFDGPFREILLGGAGGQAFLRLRDKHFRGEITTEAAKAGIEAIGSDDDGKCALAIASEAWRICSEDQGFVSDEFMDLVRKTVDSFGDGAPRVVIRKE